MLSKIHKGFALSLVTHLITLQSQSSYGLVETLKGEFKRKTYARSRNIFDLEIYLFYIFNLS